MIENNGTTSDTANKSRNTATYNTWSLFVMCRVFDPSDDFVCRCRGGFPLSSSSSSSAINNKRLKPPAAKFSWNLVFLCDAISFLVCDRVIHNSQRAQPLPSRGKRQQGSLPQSCRRVECRIRTTIHIRGSAPG